MGIFDQLASQLAVTAAQGASQSLSRVATLGLQSALSGLGILNPALNGTSQFNIDEFRTNLSAHGELARMDKFNVMIVVPQVVQFATGTNMRELTLQCEAAELPSRDVTHIEYRHYGFIRRIPHMNQYGQATFTFIVTGDMWEKRLFDRWLDVMVPTNSGLATYPLDNQGNQVYEAPIIVNQWGTNGQVIYNTVLIDAIPTSVSPLGLDWSSDQPHKLTVTFNFRKWVSDSTNATVAPTDFGTAVGGNASVTAVNPINNQTNVPGANSGILGSFASSPIGQSVVNGSINALTSLAGQTKFRIRL